MLSKRGLSDVITTVLIILLAIAAIAIVWGFVQPTLNKAGEGLSAQCLQTDVEATNCVINPDDTADVTYQWKSGDSLTGVKLVLSDGSDSTVVDSSAPSGVLATTTESGIDVSALSGTITVQAVPVVSTESGDSQTCSADGAVEITCTAAA